MCHCAPGYTGTNCDVELGPCDGVLCQNGGKCIASASTGSFECLCPNGFVGKHCEEDENECAQYNPCLNGGLCMDEVNNYKCQCLDGFSGTLCQYAKDTCYSSPCFNGGSCVALPGGAYYCRCLDGFDGKRCESAVGSACDSRPCRNGGTCLYTVEGFRCLCPPCYFGADCMQTNTQCIFAARSNATLGVQAAAPEQNPDPGTGLRDVLLVLLLSACLLASLSLVAVYYRQRKRRRASTDPIVQNSSNESRLSKYREQKACSLVCGTMTNSEITYHEQQRVARPQKWALENGRREWNSDREYSERYGVEPTVEYRTPHTPFTVIYNKANVRQQDREDAAFESDETLSAKAAHTVDDYYEEIDDAPTTVALSDAAKLPAAETVVSSFVSRGLLNDDDDGEASRRQLDCQRLSALQTNL